MESTVSEATGEERVSTQVQLAVLTQQMTTLESAVGEIKGLLNNRKTPWYNFVGAVTFVLLISGGIYLRFEDSIQTVASANQKLEGSNNELRYRLDRIEDRVFDRHAAEPTVRREPPHQG